MDVLTQLGIAATNFTQGAEILHTVIGYLQGKSQSIKNNTSQICINQPERFLVTGKKAEGEPMPPKYADGSYRTRKSGLIEYRFMQNAGKSVRR